MPEELLTVKQAAEALTLCEQTLRKWIFLRRIESVRIGGAVRIKRSTLDALIANGTTPATEN